MSTYLAAKAGSLLGPQLELTARILTGGLTHLAWVSSQYDGWVQE